MIKPTTTIIIAALALFVGTSPAAAQLFGQRTLGRTLSRQPGPAEEVGQITGGERFLRGNRSLADFVGRDLSERQNFVGIEQGIVRGRAISAVDNLRNPPPSNVNQVGPVPASTARRAYRPRLEIDFSYSPLPATDLRATLEQSLNNAPALAGLGPIQLRLEDRTAILAGVVATEHERALAEQLVLLEPGISRVRNLLVVAEPPAEQSAPRD